MSKVSFPTYSSVESIKQAKYFIHYWFLIRLPACSRHFIWWKLGLPCQKLMHCVINIMSLLDDGSSITYVAPEPLTGCIPQYCKLWTKLSLLQLSPELLLGCRRGGAAAIAPRHALCYLPTKESLLSHIQLLDNSWMCHAHTWPVGASRRGKGSWMKCVIKNSFYFRPRWPGPGMPHRTVRTPPTASEAGWVPFEGGGGRLLSDA